MLFGMVFNCFQIMHYPKKNGITSKMHAVVEAPWNHLKVSSVLCAFSCSYLWGSQTLRWYSTTRPTLEPSFFPWGWSQVECERCQSIVAESRFAGKIQRHAHWALQTTIYWKYHLYILMGSHIILNFSPSRYSKGSRKFGLGCKASKWEERWGSQGLSPKDYLFFLDFLSFLFFLGSFSGSLFLLFGNFGFTASSCSAGSFFS